MNKKILKIYFEFEENESLLKLTRKSSTEIFWRRISRTLCEKTSNEVIKSCCTDLLRILCLCYFAFANQRMNTSLEICSMGIFIQKSSFSRKNLL